jgi:hypothetical protein
MTALQAIDFGRWVLTIGATLAFVSINLKTKWWRTTTGLNVFCLVTTFFITVVIINLAVYDFIDPPVQIWLFAGLYTLFGLVLSWRAITMWVLNTKFWAWTKEA